MPQLFANYSAPVQVLSGGGVIAYTASGLNFISTTLALNAVTGNVDVTAPGAGTDSVARSSISGLYATQVAVQTQLTTVVGNQSGMIAITKGGQFQLAIDANQNVAVDLSKGSQDGLAVYDLLLSGTVNFLPPTGPSNIQRVMFRLQQSVSGLNTCSYNPVYRFSSSNPKPILSISPSKQDYLGWVYNPVNNSGTASMDFLAFTPGF